MGPLLSPTLPSVQGYYNDNGLVRIERWSQGYNFMQWGIASDPYVAQNYSFTIPDDPPCYDVVPKPIACLGNTRGTFALAADASKAASRSTMVFVNMEDNSYLDGESGFVPFGVVADEESWAALLNVTDRWLETIYLPMVYGGGSAWLRSSYPGLDYTTTAISVSGGGSSVSPSFAASLAPSVQATALASNSGSPRNMPSFSYNVSWIGNTNGGGPDPDNPRNASWVSYCADDIYVDGAGWTFTNTGWDEGTREAGIYAPDGAVAGLMADLHGWSRSGGAAVAAGPVASNRVYIGMSQVRQRPWETPHMETSGSPFLPLHFPQAPLSYPGPLRDYPSFDTWYAVRTYDRDGNVVPCPPDAGCHGWDSSLLVVCSNCSALAGLATSPDGSVLYVSDTSNGIVRRYNSTSRAQLGSWPWPRPGKLAVEPATGNVWVAPWTNVSGLQVRARGSRRGEGLRRRNG